MPAPVIEQIQGSRCPQCGTAVVPPARFCPWHPVAMAPVSLTGLGEIVTFTTLHSPPEGFRSPLHLALVELQGGARLVCHGEATRGIRIGSRVAIEAVDRVYYFAPGGARSGAALLAARRASGRAPGGDRPELGEAPLERTWT